MTKTPCHKAQLLLVEDDRLILHTLAVGLRSYGYTVLEADCAEAAMAIARVNRIDLAMLDIRMPGMSGLDVAALLKDTFNIPCMLLSAYADDAIVERAAAEGALGYLVKPIDVPRIVPAIEAALARSRELLELRKVQAMQNSTLNRIRTESAACLASVVDSAMDAILTVDDTGRILVFNRAAESLFRCKAVDTIGEHFENFIPQRFRTAHHAHVRGFSNDGTSARKMGQRTEVIGLRGGEEFPIEATIATAVVAGRKQLTVMMRDISERKAAEEIRQQLEAKLIEAKKLEAIGTLAGGIAHDFNNITAAIMGNAALACQDIDPGHPARVCLEEIEKAGSRAKRLIEQVLTFSRRQSPEMADTLLCPLIDEVVKMLGATIPASIEIIPRCNSQALSVRGNATQIVQILLNLCTNAWHAMDGRAGRIEIDCDEITCQEDTTSCPPGLPPGRYARLRVSDNGRGIDAATMTRIFEPFFTTKDRGQGTGMGLAILDGIVKSHGGGVTVNSKPGTGTTFHVYLPAAAHVPEAERPRKEQAAQAPDRGNGQHLLYVDDDEAIVFMVVRMFRSYGYRVSGYESGPDALAAVRAQPADFDMAITDFNMPGMSGLDLARELARIKPDLPVVIASGYVTDELQEKSKAAGVRLVICKPNTIDELCKLIQPMLAAAAQRPVAYNLTAC